jgi:hypothetical protein
MDFTSAIPPGNAGGISAFDNTEPAPIPPGAYFARVQKGEYCTTKSGADGYRMRFEVTEGHHAGRSQQIQLQEKRLKQIRRLHKDLCEAAASVGRVLDFHSKVLGDRNCDVLCDSLGLLVLAMMDAHDEAVRLDQTLRVIQHLMSGKASNKKEIGHDD